MRPTISCAVLVLVAVACGQDQLVAPDEPVLDAPAASENVLLADPLVTLLLGSLTDPTAVDAVRVALARVSGDAPATSPAVLAEDVARVGSLVQELANGDTTASHRREVPNDLVALTALGLLLEHASEGKARAVPGQGQSFDRPGVRRPRN